MHCFGVLRYEDVKDDDPRGKDKVMRKKKKKKKRKEKEREKENDKKRGTTVREGGKTKRVRREEKGEWPCRQCTYQNPPSFLACEVCGSVKK